MIPSSRPLNIPVLIAVGVFFWLVAALMIRFLGPTLLIPGSAGLAVILLVSVGISWGFVLSGKLMAGLRGPSVLPGVVIMTSTAMLLDGLAMFFFPALYGGHLPHLGLGAAWLLWGVGWAQFIALRESVQNHSNQ